MRRLIIIVFLLSIVISGLGCVGPKIAGKADSDTPFQKALGRGTANVMMILDEMERAIDEGDADAKFAAGAIGKITVETEAMVAAAEGHPVTAEEIDILDNKLSEYESNAYELMGDLDEEDRTEALHRAWLAFEARIRSLQRRLDDRLQAVAPWRADSVEILPGDDDDGPWFAFRENEKSNLWGYEDKSGAVRIAPRFFSRGTKFDVPCFEHVAAVGENRHGRWDNYYLTKAGKIFGRDSVYEKRDSEGFIRFKDKTTELMGMFDRHGNVVIPAQYDELSSVLDSMVIAYKSVRTEEDAGKDNDVVDDDDADYEDADDDDVKHDDIHGRVSVRPVKMAVIHAARGILLEADTHSGHILDLSTILKTDAPHPDTLLRTSFPAKDGSGFYSFVCHEKEFRRWLKNLIASGLTPKHLTEAVSDTVSCFMRPRDDEDYAAVNWKSPRQLFVDKTSGILKNDLAALLDTNRKHVVSSKESSRFKLSPEDPSYGKYFDNCGNARPGRVTAFQIMLAPSNFEDPFGRYNHYSFDRTDGGYKLTGAQIRNNDCFLAAHPDICDGDLITLGNRRLNNGDYDEAIALYNEALLKDSASATGWQNLSAAMILTGNPARAIDAVNRAIKLGVSDSAGSYSNRAVLYYQTGEFAKGLTDIERSIRIAPAINTFMQHRAVLYAAMGDYKKSEADYLEAIKIKNNAPVFHNYSLLCAYMGDERKADSLDKIALRLGWGDKKNYYTDDAEDYTSIIKHLPKNAVARYHRGVIYARRGEYAKAVEDFKAALKINPGHALAKRWIDKIKVK